MDPKVAQAATPATGDTSHFTRLLPDELIVAVFAQAKLTPTQALGLAQSHSKLHRASRDNAVWRNLASRPPGPSPSHTSIADAISAMPPASKDVLRRLWACQKSKQPLPDALAVEVLRDYTEDAQVALATLKLDGALLPHFSPALRDDPTMVKMAMRTCPRAFAHASERLRGDVAFATRALITDGYNYTFASEALRNTPAFALRALRTQDAQWPTLSAALYADVRFVRKALAKHPNELNLGEVPAEIMRVLWQDATFIEKLLRINPSLGLTAPKQSVTHPRLIALMLAYDASLFELVHPLMLEDREAVRAMLQVAPAIFALFPEAMRDDLELAMGALGAVSRWISSAGPKVLDNDAFILACSLKLPKTLRWASARLQDNLTFVQKIITNSKTNIEFVSDAIRDNTEFQAWLADQKNQQPAKKKSSRPF